MKLFKNILPILFFTVSFSFTTAFAESSETRRLEDNIASLKDKIKNSSNKDPKDIQKLYKLENELQKKIYLKQNAK